MKLNYRRTILIGFAFMSISAFWQLYDSIVPKILTNVFGLGSTLRGVIMAMDNVLALILLPLFGALSDRCDTPLGKRMPFILFGTAGAISAMMTMSVAADMGSFILFIAALGIALLSMGTYRSPAVALMPDLTPPALRSKANAVINLMGTIGGVYSLVFISLLVKEGGSYIPIFACVAGFMAVSVIVLTATINERKIKVKLKEEGVRLDDVPGTDSGDAEGSAGKLPSEVKRSLWLLLVSVFLWFTAYNAVTSVYSVYAEKVWGLKGGSFAPGLIVAMAAAVVAYVPIGYLSTAFGRKKVILAGIALMAASFGSMVFIKTYSPIVYVLFVTVGFGWASINVNSYPMVVQMGREGDIGKFTGIYYTFSMSAQILTPILSGWFIDLFDDYRVLFPYSFVFSALAFLVFSFVKHGDTKPAKPASLLENYDVGND